MSLRGAAESRTAADELRPLLYGDVPLTRWAAGDESFQMAHEAIGRGDVPAAYRHLYGIIEAPGRASRDCLLAWQELRALGETPNDPTHVYGVVIDMPVGAGLDTLAAYEDGTCRYLNHSGKVIVWEARDDQIDNLVRGVLAAGSAIVARIGPWQGTRPPLRGGMLRLSMLCAGGLYFGEGPVEALALNPMAVPLVNAAAGLLQALTSRAL